MKNAFITVATVTLLNGCASAVDRHKTLYTELNMPVDCEHAERQLNTLERHYVSGGEQFVNGVASILPTAAIVSLIRGEYLSRWKLANGDFNAKIAMKMKQFKAVKPFSFCFNIARI